MDTALAKDGRCVKLTLLHSSLGKPIDKCDTSRLDLVACVHADGDVIHADNPTPAQVSVCSYRDCYVMVTVCCLSGSEAIDIRGKGDDPQPSSKRWWSGVIRRPGFTWVKKSLLSVAGQGMETEGPEVISTTFFCHNTLPTMDPYEMSTKTDRELYNEACWEQPEQAKIEVEVILQP